MLHISAGAVVYRHTSEGVEIVVLYRKKTDTYHLPKGTQEPGESLADTARREIAEETGCQVRLEQYLGNLSSSFERGPERVNKLTHYYLACYESGTVIEHDSEHDRVLFLSLEEALSLFRDRGAYNILGYEDECQILALAGRRLNR
ncbi:MAG: Hydrolase, nudix family [Candidatus Magasanikbacteria bacterium GW2011_GWA2_56_11]|uniref:Hydrolase, nudix family n=1 Tax=Candidatus Magasanikbacteria bacterium GW2011_GWA2_56_11 TaxID=1619044 RepID=A0A0G1YGS8_9BACT|nr:MAG: Hydrolase, nudix family [Candidatus Magasanikbacteria bacterium GW2011_GWA2_56_11]